MGQTFGIDISPEFIESGKINRGTGKKKGGPYSNDEKIKRQNEVHKLHFEYGYSARKISELLKASRNTINGDVSYWYSKVAGDHERLNHEPHIIANIERLEIQRTRLRERLDTVQSFQQIHATEKMILEIDSKIINIRMKLGESFRQIEKGKTEFINSHLESMGEDFRYLNFSDIVPVSSKTRDRISKIMKDDLKKFNGD